LLSLSILSDDIVANLYRREERQLTSVVSESELSRDLQASRWSTSLAMIWLKRRIEIIGSKQSILLSDKGRERARSLVRSHRLWENYLASQVLVESDRLHGLAERFEHFTGRELREQLDKEMDAPSHDPHGSVIPLE